MPIVAGVLVGFAIIMAALAVVGLHHSSNMFLKPLVLGLAHPRSFLGRIIRHTPLVILLSGTTWLLRYIQSALSHWAHGHLGVLTKFFHGHATIAHHTNRELQAISETNAYAFDRFHHHVMPRAITKQVAPVRHEAALGHSLGLKANARWRAEQRSRRRSISHINTKLGALALGFLGIDYLVKRHHAKAHQHAHIHTIPHTAAQAGRTAAQVKAHARRLSRLERLLGVGALATALTVALARLIPSWQCRNFRNIRRLLNCSHWRWLEALLFLAVDALIVRDLCLLVGYVERGAAAFQPVIHELVVAGENFICGDPRHMPSALTENDRADSRGFASGVGSRDLAL